MTSDSENLDEEKKNLNKKIKIREITTGSFWTDVKTQFKLASTTLESGINVLNRINVTHDLANLFKKTSP